MNLAVIALAGDPQRARQKYCAHRVLETQNAATTDDFTPRISSDRVRRSALIHLSTCVLVISLSVGMHKVGAPRSHGRWPLGRLITQNLWG